MLNVIFLSKFGKIESINISIAFILGSRLKEPIKQIEFSTLFERDFSIFFICGGIICIYIFFTS